jgi:hypothetical protein
MAPHLEGGLSPSKERDTMLPIWNRLIALSRVHGLKSMPTYTDRICGHASPGALLSTRQRASEPA